MRWAQVKLRDGTVVAGSYALEPLDQAVQFHFYRADGGEEMTLSDILAVEVNMERGQDSLQQAVAFWEQNEIEVSIRS